ncbi:hypothetical protein [Terrisporobacter glycolicus]|uniref:Uncharacterized protein n=1 Tax=Terrisporobacter glycolicus ATCC 14880 = DSM 1288 TaxID=1121315 RepID=A0ABZ2EZR0_9FIRM|nr:hypothetical protein [Terrisporobacter glycolicus]
MNLNTNNTEKKRVSLTFFTLGIISLLIFPITILLSKIIYVLENPDIVFITLGDKWIYDLSFLSKFATFFSGILGIVLLTLAAYFFSKEGNK